MSERRTGATSAWRAWDVCVDALSRHVHVGDVGTAPTPPCSLRVRGEARKRGTRLAAARHVGVRVFDLPGRPLAVQGKGEARSNDRADISGGSPQVRLHRGVLLTGWDTGYMVFHKWAYCPFQARWPRGKTVLLTVFG
jgi:hypothetical protein